MLNETIREMREMTLTNQYKTRTYKIKDGGELNGVTCFVLEGPKGGELFYTERDSHFRIKRMTGRGATELSGTIIRPGQCVGFGNYVQTIINTK